MRIAYVTTYDARNIACWSGLGYFIWRSLSQRGIKVELIGPLSLSRAVRKMLELKGSFYGRALGQFYLPDRDVLTSKAYCHEVARQLEALRGIDAVVSPGSIPVAFLPGNLPLITYSDATAGLLFDAYPGYENLCATSRRHGNRVERAALNRASAAVFASDWAADSAIRLYSANPKKIHVVPFGANFEHPPERAEVIRAIEARPFDEVRLLFIGVEWERKGGPAALETVRRLRGQGVSAQLTVVGCEPVIGAEDAGHVLVRGFIEKTAEGQKEIFDLLARSHFLIVPSRAECYGLVYCEASAFGVPSIARNVGGVSTIIRQEANGRLFELQQSAADMADWILRMVKNPETYRRLALSSRTEYESRLNWTVAGSRLEEIIRAATHP